MANDPAFPKFKVGQTVMYKRPPGSKKREFPLTILDAMEDSGVWFYRIDRKNYLAETMIRALTHAEAGGINNAL